MGLLSYPLVVSVKRVRIDEGGERGKGTELERKTHFYFRGDIVGGER